MMKNDYRRPVIMPETVLAIVIRRHEQVDAELTRLLEPKLRAAVNCDYIHAGFRDELDRLDAKIRELLPLVDETV